MPLSCQNCAKNGKKKMLSGTSLHIYSSGCVRDQVRTDYCCSRTAHNITFHYRFYIVHVSVLNAQLRDVVSYFIAKILKKTSSV